MSEEDRRLARVYGGIIQNRIGTLPWRHRQQINKSPLLD
jgi:hypothetical protein